MKQLAELTERLASTIVMTDADDLQGLAGMHEALRQVSKLLDETPAAQQIGTVAQSSSKLIEQIMLRELTDTGAALKSVSQQVAELQKLVDAAASGGATAGTATTAPAPVSVASTTVTPAADTHDTSVPAESNINPDDLPLIAEFTAEAASHIATAEAELLKLEEAPDDLEAINAIFRSFHTVKGVAGFLNLRQIGALAHAAENLLDLARHSKLTFVPATVDLVLEAIDLLKGLIAMLEDAAKSGGAPAVEGRLPALLARLHACAAGETPVATKPTASAAVEAAPTATPTPAAVSAPPATAAVPAQAAPAKPASDHAPAAGASSATQADATVKVSTDRLDNLINMVGELVIAQAMVTQDTAGQTSTNHRLARNMAHLGKITRELQDLSMSMRMVPIQGVFQKMNRLIRDLARKIGKEIDFVVTGGETELDRNVVEAVSDPLVHMVRNSVDHGVEMPEDREKVGKPRTGRVELKAYHHSGNVVIEIKDDGKGLNKARILKKAIANGIVKEGQELSEQDIFKLIFAAGLSTAEKVTDISGRGVGMDVVKRNIEAMRGRIEISSVEGQGSTFTIRLPLTLAVIDGLVVKVGSERYIVPITSIEQSIRPKKEQLSTVQNRGELCLVRGALLPMVRLHKLFNVTPKHEDPTQTLVVIVHDNDRRCCLLVDELLGQQQVVIKSLGENFGTVRGISGGAILGDGNVSLILDVPGLIDLSSK